jgi:hypothetical protein
MKKLIFSMLGISLFVSLTAVAFVDDKGSTKATKTQSRNVKRTHSPITGKDETIKATKK